MPNAKTIVIYIKGLSILAGNQLFLNDFVQPRENQNKNNLAVTLIYFLLSIVVEKVM